MVLSTDHYIMEHEHHKEELFTLYKGIRAVDKTTVLIKVFNSKQPTLEEIDLLKNEYDIIKDMREPEVLNSIELERYKNAYRLILEYFPGITLEEALLNHAFDLNGKLEVAIRITQALGAIHEHKIIHHDIQPKHILIDPKSLQVKITGFEIASRAPTDNTLAPPRITLKGNLSYVSPEQTGRMNRQTDYRTDYYSLGVTLYELFTGKLPFNVLDPMEMIHAHIAKAPPPPHLANPNIPIALSEIIMKLMAKTVEERYNSAYGIVQDLHTCLHDLKTKGYVDLFPLGTKDILHNLQISKRVIGREDQVKTVLKTFEKACFRGPYLVLIKGYAGVGKSSIVSEVKWPVKHRGGYFIKGKCDQYRSNIPYFPFLDAFRDLIQQILTENDQIIGQWRDRLTYSLGDNLYALTEMVPELKLIVGKTTPPTGSSDSSSRENRFQIFLGNFIASLADSETPLVIYLDDLQWIDIGSVKILEMIMELKCKGLLLIGSFRDNEMLPTHPFLKLIERISFRNERVEMITVSPLSYEDVLEIISETLHTSPSKCSELAQIVTRKTQGNPYFVNQLLNYLYEEKLLSFDTVLGSWSWDMGKLHAVSISDNVIDLLIQKLQKCPPATQQLLQAAACTGNTFNIELLSAVTDLSNRNVILRLKHAVKEGFIIAADSVNKIFSELSEEAIDYLNPSLMSHPFRFSHDRVQQASHATLTDQERAKIHLKVARILGEKLSNSLMQDQIFEVVYHYNQAKELLNTEDDKICAAELNCAAAKKAIQAIAYSQALFYLNTGLELLPENKWTKHYSLALEMNMLIAESTFMVGEFDKASEIFESILNLAKTDDERLAILTLKIKLNVHALRYDKAIEYGRIALRILGVKLPERWQAFFAFKELLISKCRLAFSRFSSLPNMKDPRILKAVHILFLLSPASYFIKRELSLFIIAKAINLNFKYGLAPESPFSLVSYGVILSSVFKEYDQAYDLGRSGLNLIPRFPNAKCITSARYTFSSFLQPYKDHIKSCINDLSVTFEEGIISGEWIFALFSLGTMISYKFFSGETIEDIYKQVLKYEDFVSKVKAHNVDTIFECWLNTMTPLREQNPDPWSDPKNKFLDEPLPEHLDSKKLLTFYFDLTFKMQLAYLFGHYDKALQFAKDSDIFSMYARRHMITVENKFYRALSLAGIANAKDSAKIEAIESLAFRLKKLSESCPPNFLHKYLLVKAEIARILGKKEVAIECYDASIESARENGYVQNEALANELFAHFYLGLNKEAIAKQYLLKAAYGYYRWGARSKVAQLQKAYPNLLPVNTLPELQQSQPLSSSELDLALLFKTSQLIAKEIELDKLLEQTARQMIQITDSTRSYILIDQKGEWIVGAGAGSPYAEMMQSKPIKELSNELPLSIIQTVIKTRESIVLENVNDDGIFNNDPYIKRSAFQGVLCFPLIHKAKLTGVLYLEKQAPNNRTLPEKVELTRVLTGQIATAIENANLYNNISIMFSQLKVSNEKMEENIQNLERTINSRTQELSKKNQELEMTLKQIKEIQKRLIEQEKLVSMGSITKSVAFDIYQPMENILKLAKSTMGLIGNLRQSLDGSSLLNILETNVGKVIEHTTKADEIIATLTLNSQEAAKDMEEIDINKLIKDYAELVYASYYRKDPTFSLTLETSYDSTIGKFTAYPGDLGRVFYNIIDNACYSTDRKKRDSSVPYSPIVSITTSNLMDRISIRIWDNGEGIPEAIMEKLYTPFLSTKSKTTNAGMGLSISYDIIVNQHGGKIDVKSKPGEFTEVIIMLPKT